MTERSRYEMKSSGNGDSTIQAMTVMTEKVEIGDATLYHGDCIDVIPSLPQSDLIVTDPPYGVAFQGRAGVHAKIANDHKSASVNISTSLVSG